MDSVYPTIIKVADGNIDQQIRTVKLPINRAVKGFAFVGDCYFIICKNGVNVIIDGFLKDLIKIQEDFNPKFKNYFYIQNKDDIYDLSVDVYDGDLSVYVLWGDDDL